MNTAYAIFLVSTLALGPRTVVARTSLDLYSLT